MTNENAFHAVPKHRCGIDYVLTDHEMSHNPGIFFDREVHYCLMCRLYSFATTDELVRHVTPFETEDPKKMREYLSGLIKKDRI